MNWLFISRARKQNGSCLSQYDTLAEDSQPLLTNFSTNFFSASSILQIYFKPLSNVNGTDACSFGVEISWKRLPKDTNPFTAVILNCLIVAVGLFFAILHSTVPHFFHT